MASVATHHSPHGAGDFLGLRTTRTGELQVVYDDGVARRMIWRVDGSTDVDLASAALKAALDANRVLPALYAEMRKRAIALEAVARV